MNLRNALFVSLALLAPASTAFAAINDDGDGGGGGDVGDDDSSAGVPTIYQKTYNKHDYWGLDDWGAGYEVTGRLYAMPKWSSYNDRLGVRMSAEAFTRLNGTRYSLFRGVASGNTEAKKKTEASVNAYVGSALIYSKAYTSTTSTKQLFNENKSWSQTFFDKRIPVSVLGLPVSFRAKATGVLALSASGKLSNVGVEATATPTGSADLYLSAAVGGEYCVSGVCVGVEAGVYSDVTLLAIMAPASASTWWALSPAGGVSVNYQAKADLSISSLNGEAGVYGEACLGACIHKELKLVDWDGWTKTYSIANYSGSYCLAGTCTASSISMD